MNLSKDDFHRDWLKSIDWPNRNSDMETLKFQNVPIIHDKFMTSHNDDDDHQDTFPKISTNNGHWISPNQLSSLPLPPSDNYELKCLTQFNQIDKLKQFLKQEYPQISIQRWIPYIEFLSKMVVFHIYQVINFIGSIDHTDCTTSLQH
ncbi:hypothetical protein DERP_014769 [Dermatophagoides pteronyssinus]|uniref:Uncharacterized protein n=1 Tax=Dermatophagoides pteronyssinus TaxID=6956 RepID=A0ABQ8JCD2_DERPT|nr:hypothetical protein DERP_014769 [Dermatophagoides pteronyssinus]